MDRHLDDQHRGRRLCTSYEQGVIGSKLWAVRHQVRLRGEVDQRIKQLRNGKPYIMR